MADKIFLDNDKTVILIDASYYVFYRYFATMRWFSFQKKEFDIENIHEDKEFITSFIKHVDSDITKICKKWKTTKNNIILCSDCQRCNIWRNDLYKDYKGSRIQNTNFNGSIFNIFYDHINIYNIKKVFFERLEADDVIFLLYKQIKNHTNNITIISNDNDYLQLTDGNIQIVNMQFKDITQRGNKDPLINLYYKAIYGDKSDNISKISSNITKDKAQQLSELNENELINWLEQNKLLDKFNFNMNLINFNNIPNQYVDTFYEKYEIEIL